MDLKEITVEEKEVYTCPIFRVTQGVVQLPDQHLTDRNRVLHNGGSGVLPIDADGQILLVEQYRYGIGRITLEIPAGKLEKGEDPKQCALRELREEVGGTTDQLIDLGILAPTPAYDSEIIYIYMAECNGFMPPKPDEDEFLQVHKMSLDEAVALVLSGEIIDAKTQIALLKAHALRNK